MARRLQADFQPPPATTARNAWETPRQAGVASLDAWERDVFQRASACGTSELLQAYVNRALVRTNMQGATPSLDQAYLGDGVLWRIEQAMGFSGVAREPPWLAPFQGGFDANDQPWMSPTASMHATPEHPGRVTHVRPSTIWLATLRKAEVILRCALPGDVIVGLDFPNTASCYTEELFDLSLDVSALRDIMRVARWLDVTLAGPRELASIIGTLFDPAQDIYRVDPASVYDHGWAQATSDLSKLNGKRVKIYLVSAVAPEKSYSKQTVTAFLMTMATIKDPVTGAVLPTTAWDRFYEGLHRDMFLDGHDRMLDLWRKRIDVLSQGRLLVHPVTNARAVSFYSWMRRSETIFDAQHLDPRELAIMGQRAASYVMHQLGFPQGLESDRYLVELSQRMKYLMRKGTAHLSQDNINALCHTALSLSPEERARLVNLTKSQEQDVRDGIRLIKQPITLPKPRPYATIRRKRGTLGQDYDVLPKVFLLTDL